MDAWLMQNNECSLTSYLKGVSSSLCAPPPCLFIVSVGESFRAGIVDHGLSSVI